MSYRKTLSQDRSLCGSDWHLVLSIRIHAGGAAPCGSFQLWHVFDFRVALGRYDDDDEVACGRNISFTI